MQERHNSDADKTSTEEKGKKPYAKPTLVVLGAARDRTEFTLGGASDGTTSSNAVAPSS